jgi:hypothetical protein
VGPGARTPAPARERRVVSAIYPGHGLALARFAHLLARDDGDPVADELRRGRASLARDGAIVAEVTYMHGARTANAGLRPALFDHEIELPGDACSPGAIPIPLADLLVRWDPVARRFVLRRTDGVEVIPTLSSGIAPEGFVSFLLAIGRQHTQPLSFFPGFERPGVQRWPCFTWEDTVVFRARRELRAAQVPLAAGAAPAERFLAIARWRRSHDLPRRAFVSSAAEPKPFYIDFDSPAMVELFAHLAAPALAAPDGVLHVTEMLPGPEHLWVGDEGEACAAEFLVQLQGGR